MPVFLSPGVYAREIDLSLVPAAVGALTPAFIGTAKKGPLQEPTFISNAQQFIDTFGEPFPESFLGYAVIAYFELGNRAWVMRVGVECEQGQPTALADICIDRSGSREHGWGRVAVFTGIAYGQICSRVISAEAPLNFHEALVHDIDYNDVEVSPTDGPANATLSFPSLHSYLGSIDDSFVMLILSDPTTVGSTFDGAAYQVIRNSDGLTIIGTLVESIVPGTSTLIDIGDGLVFQVVVVGTSPIGTNDTFIFQAQPDNRKFSFNVDHQDPMTVTEYTTPVSSYNNATDYADAVNTGLGGGADYRAIAQDDGTVCFRTDVAGNSLQLVSTEAFALEVGQVLYAYDIPRSYLQSTDSGPYDITSSNNRISMNIIGSTSTTLIEFTLSVGMSVTPSSLAAQLHNAGVQTGTRYWRAFSMLVPGGYEEVFIETIVDNQFSQLQMLADTAHLKTLRFSEALEILYPYTRPYEVFTDSRVYLPESGSSPAQPLSCDLNPLSDECAADTAYFQNIVGWIVAKSAGTWIDGYQISLQIYRQGTSGGDVAGRYQIIITDLNGNSIESVDNVSFDTQDTRYIANIINPGSPIGGANGDLYIEWIPRPSFLNNDPDNDPVNYEVRLPGSFYRRSWTGAANGIPTDPAYSTELDRVIIGSPAEETGIFAFQNPEVYDITLLIIPGASSGAVIGQGLQMCEARGDVLMIIDPPFGLRAQQVVDWHNGMLYSDLAQAINSSYGALYFPWLQIFDQFSGQTIYIPPSGHVSAVYARTANVAEQWFAPAGLTRGRILTALDTEVDLTQGERDLLYGYGNAVNPIVNFPQDGITVWGQRTLQRASTALDRVNVRMLLIFIKKNALQFLRQFVFEPNDATTRAQVVNVSNPFLAEIQARRGLTGFEVVCDERNNTAERIDRNELHVAYFLKPTRAAEFIQLNLVVLRTEASFTSAEVLAAAGLVTA